MTKNILILVDLSQTSTLLFQSCVFYAIFKILSIYFQSKEAYFVVEKKLNTTNSFKLTLKDQS